MRYKVTLIEGDGIGPEVTGATAEILEAAGAPGEGLSGYERATRLARPALLVEADREERPDDQEAGHRRQHRGPAWRPANPFRGNS